MLQFYLLSVLLNVLVGLVLLFSFDNAGEKTDSLEAEGITRIDDPSLFENRTFRFVLGIAAVVVGLLKLFVVAGGVVTKGPESFVILGDFIPAIAGIAGGVAVLLRYFTVNSTVEITVTGLPETIFVKGARIIGIACIAAAVLHFIFPRVILL